jgi:hypothetical protein
VERPHCTDGVGDAIEDFQAMGGVPSHFGMAPLLIVDIFLDTLASAEQNSAR